MVVLKNNRLNYEFVKISENKNINQTIKNARNFAT